jgi:hypothetical protein
MTNARKVKVTMENALLLGIPPLTEPARYILYLDLQEEFANRAKPEFQQGSMNNFRRVLVTMENGSLRRIPLTEWARYVLYLDLQEEFAAQAEPQFQRLRANSLQILLA